MIPRSLALLVSLPLAAALCRYTVRDVGFVDLGDPGYRYYAFVADAALPGVTSACRRIATTVFADTNIEFAVVDRDEDHPGQRYVRELKIDRFPTTVLVHPEGHAIELPFDGSFAETGAALFESVASSKLRRRITEAVLRRYCVVLLIEGDDAKRNRDAAAAVRSAFASIDRVFDSMPKKVGTLPELIALPRAAQAGEHVLLWALGVDDGAADPVVAIVAGRGRQFGSILEGDDITEDSVLAILAKVGESCECRLDRSWMRGLRIPLRWDADTRQLAVDELGFDPDNPLVKAEISSILSRGLNGQAREGGGEPTVADLLLGYSEGVLDDELIDGDLGSEELPVDDAAPGGISIWLTLGALLIANLGVAAFVFMRVRRS